jgi:lysophospholipase L1-like esterase
MAGRGRVIAVLVRLASSAAMLAAAVPIAACSGEAEPPNTPRSHRVAIIGDSFTEGSGEGGVGWRSWPAVLRHYLLQTGLTIDLDVAAEGSAGYTHHGHSGNVFGDKASVLGHDDDLVIFFGSSNDAGADPATLDTAVRDTLAKARTSAPGAKFIVIGPAWPNAKPPEDVAAARDVIRDEANQSGMQFVDPIAEKWFVDAPELIGGDGVHPNDRGHEHLAEKIAVLVEGALVDG